MFSVGSKVFLGLAGLAAVAAVVFGFATGDRAGVALLAFLAGSALVVGLAAIPVDHDLALSTAEADGLQPPAGDLAPPASSWPFVAALGLAMLAVGAATDAVVFGTGIAVTVVGALAWFGMVWAEHPAATNRVVHRVTERFLVPLGLPLSAFALGAFVVLNFSRLLLALPKSGSTIVAVVAAVGILGVCALVATRENVGRSAMTALVTVAVALTVASGVAGQVAGEREFEHHGAGAGHEGEGEGGGDAAADHEGEEGDGEDGGGGGAAFEISASTATSFDTDTLQFPAGEPVELHFSNEQRGVPHNVSVYSDPEGAETLFQGQLIGGGEDIVYEIDPLEAGSYYFRCDVHPNMNGTLEVTPA